MTSARAEAERRDDGGSAFPSEQHECQDNTWNQTFDPGMSLRDWFAGQALSKSLSDGIHTDSEGMKVVARAAYEMADAMLKEREK